MGEYIHDIIFVYETKRMLEKHGDKLDDDAYVIIFVALLCYMDIAEHPDQFPNGGELKSEFRKAVEKIYSQLQ